MSYSQFADDLLLGIVEAVDANPRGQADVSSVASNITPRPNEQWVRDAVQEFQDRGYFNNLSRPLSGAILCDVTGAARRAAEAIKVQRA